MSGSGVAPDHLWVCRQRLTIRAQPTNKGAVLERRLVTFLNGCYGKQTFSFQLPDAIRNASEQCLCRTVLMFVNERAKGLRTRNQEP